MLKLSLIILLVRPCSGAHEDFSMPHYRSAMTEALSWIITDYFKNISTTIDFIYASSDDKGKEKLEDAINEILYWLKGQIIVQIGFSPNSNRKRVHNILFCDTFESFQEILSVMNPHHFEYQGFYTIVISYSDDLYEIMTRIFEELWLRYIVNVNILWMPAENDKEAMVYTYYPYTSFYCSEAKPVQLDQYRDGAWLTKADFFPNKMTNLHGCPLRVATFSNPPFMIIVDHGQYVEVDGIDGILLRVLSQKMNFSNKLIFPADSWGELHSNGSATGISV